jgi:hypothetical protein
MTRSSRVALLGLLPITACTVTSNTTTNDGGMNDGDTSPLNDGATRDGATDATSGNDGSSSSDGATDGGTADQFSPGTLSGTLAYMDFADEAGTLPHLFSINLGAPPYTVTPLATSSNHLEAYPTFNQRTHNQLFFNETNTVTGFSTVVAASPDGSGPFTIVTTCADSSGPVTCDAAQLGNDGNVYFLEGIAGTQIYRAPATGNSIPLLWYSTATAGGAFTGCGVSPIAISRDGSTLATILYPYAGCLPDDAGASKAGVYVSPVGIASFVNPIVDNQHTSQGAWFVAFDAGGTHVYYTGSDDKLYEANIDGTSPQLVVDHAFTNQAPLGMAVVNDAWVVASERGASGNTITAYPLASQGGSPVVVSTGSGAQSLTWKP